MRSYRSRLVPLAGLMVPLVTSAADATGGKRYVTPNASCTVWEYAHQPKRVLCSQRLYGAMNITTVVRTTEPETVEFGMAMWGRSMSFRDDMVLTLAGTNVPTVMKPTDAEYLSHHRAAARRVIKPENLQTDPVKK